MPSFSFAKLVSQPRRIQSNPNDNCEWLILQDQLRWDIKRAGHNSNGFIYSKAPLLKPTEKIGFLIPQGVKQWTAIGTFQDPYWNRVKHGANLKDVPAKTQFLLWEQHSGGYGILLPLLSGDHVITLQGAKEGIQLIAANGKTGDASPMAALAYAATGKDVYALVGQSIRVIASKTKSFRLREEKAVPPFVDYLGWCSWDAFYYKINEAKFLSALRSFQKGGVKPGFVILDDGWLHNRGDLLRSFGVNKEKFPNGLDSLVKKAKELHDVKFFGIWHAMTGYWRGIDSGSVLGKKYNILRATGMLRPWLPVLKKERLYLVEPGQIARFFDEFHQVLKSSGVDLIKVDGQSSLAEFTRPHYGRVSAMRAYQQALQSSAVRHFNGGLIHCMSNGLDVAYQLEKTSVWRNSDDFFPKRNSSSQQTHVYTNAINNLWTGTFALPDWDMFQSHHRWADFHAAARALSGGPVYICDKPGRQNFTILRRLASATGRIWRCDRPALPSPESVFNDCRKEALLLKMHNLSGNIGLIGFFHCSEVRKKLKGSYSSADIPDLKGQCFISRHYTTGSIAELGINEIAHVTLPRMGFEIITLSPVLCDWLAPLGHMERYVGATCLDTSIEVSPKSCTINLRESGSYLFWSFHPVSVKAAGKNVAFSYNQKTKLLKIEAKTPGSISILRR